VLLPKYFANIAKLLCFFPIKHRVSTKSSMEKSLGISSLENFFWSVSMEEENIFPLELLTCILMIFCSRLIIFYFHRVNYYSAYF